MKDQESSPCFSAGRYPTEPGVYLMKDVRSRIIYVGKAKSLRLRLASYFRPLDQLAPKTRAMMSRVHSIDTLITATEKEALLLEAGLIKKHRPRYNIVLRDDKNYVLFTLDKSTPWPRLRLTRKYVRDGSLYFGPFTSALAARQTMKVINRIFPLRKCRDSIFRNRVRPCLQYHIGRCSAPCVHNVDPQEYAAVVRQVELFLSGRSQELIRTLKKEMQAASRAMAFEKAAMLRDQIRAVRETVERQAAVLPGGGDLDAVNLHPHPEGLRLGMVFVRGGRLMDGRGFVWRNLTPEDSVQTAEMLVSFLAQFYGPGKFVPARIVVPVALDSPVLTEFLAEQAGKKVRIGPARGSHERKLLHIALCNARSQSSLQVVDSPAARIAAKLGLEDEPERLECVDISHLGGRITRAGLVVFSPQGPVKGEFRLYDLDANECRGDDCKAVAAFMRRRLQSGPPWPDLLLIDGGRAQLAVAGRVLEEEGAVKLFPLAALAKGESRSGGELQDKLFLPGRRNSVALKPGSRELLFLQNMRDRAHDFVLFGQRRARHAVALTSRLEDLPGIGPKTAGLLWDRFGSVQSMREAGIEDFLGLPGVGRARAEKIRAALAGLEEIHDR